MKTKEQRRRHYERLFKITKPLQPKSRILKKTVQKIKATIKPTPFIPDKDKSSQPFKTSLFKRVFSLRDFFAAYEMPAFISRGWYSNRSRPTMRGMKKHASEIRQIKKAQRRRAYHQMCKRR